MSSSKCQADKAFSLKEFNPNHSSEARNGCETGYKITLPPEKTRLIMNTTQQILTLQWR